MLFVGVDWAESEHAACLVGEGGGVVRRLRVAHTRAGLDKLRAAVAAAEPDPGAVLVALERAHGLLVGGRPLRQACMQWAFCSLARSGWARAFYDRQRANGKTHFKALRALANRWLEVLHALLRTRRRYDADVHQANRTKAPRLAA